MSGVPLDSYPGDPEKQAAQGTRLGITLHDVLTQLGIYDAFSEAVQTGVANLLNYIKTETQFLERLNEWVELWRPVSDYFREISEFIDKYPQLEAEALDVLKKYHWIPFSTMPDEFLYELILLSRAPGNRTKPINLMYINYFLSNNAANLVEMVDSWRDNPLFLPRMKILRDCVAVTRMSGARLNAANVVLPTLVAQVDGILTDLGQRNGVSLPGKRGVQFNSWLTEVTKDEYFAERMNDFILQVLFHPTQNGEKEIPIPYRYNRHKVLHGQHLRYGTLPDLLRTFLVLDYLAQIQVK